MSVSDQINRVKFISEDFSTYRSEADSFYQTYYPTEFNNLIATDIGNALMDQLAFAQQAISFMVNRKSSELFLATARLNKSIVKLARMLGYPIRPAAPASTDVVITLTNGPYLYPVPITIGFQFQGPGDIIYEYRSSIDYTVAPGITVFTIPVKEGTTKSISFISDGSASQQFSLFGVTDGMYMYAEDFSVVIDGQAWTRQDLIKYEPSNVYEVLFADSPPKLRFGDGIAGNIPPEGAQIVVSFVYGKGASGSVGKNQITKPVNPIVLSGISIPMSITNSVSNVGDNPEDIRHVQSFASTYFRTQNAAVVKEDYDSISELQTGVALADAQIMRGISQDITIQAALSGIASGEVLVSQSVADIGNSSVSGQSYLGVSGFDLLSIGGKAGLSVSGISYLGSDVSGNVTGISYLGVDGINGLFISGESSLGVSGISSLGVSDLSSISGMSVSGYNLINSSVSGLTAYLSQSFSDTALANHVQMILLSVDSNNKYISPSSTVILNVQTILDTLKDAVVTVDVVDGISKVIDCDIEVEIGISQTAVKSDVELKSISSLTSSLVPYGLLVRRNAGVGLYKSDIVDAIIAGNDTGDVRFVNVNISSPLSKLDAYGNLIISSQEIIQYGNIIVTAKKRFLSSGDVITI